MIDTIDQVCHRSPGQIPGEDHGELEKTEIGGNLNLFSPVECGTHSDASTNRHGKTVGGQAERDKEYGKKIHVATSVTKLLDEGLKEFDLPVSKPKEVHRGFNP